MKLVPIGSINVTNQLRGDSTTFILKEHLLLTQLRELASLLDEASVGFMILKGFLVNRIIFAKHISPSGSDMDILIHKKDLLRFASAVCKIGYVKREFKNRREERIVLNLHNSICFFKRWGERGGSLVLDVHWDIVNPPDNKRYLLENMWKNSRIVELNGVKFRMLSNEDLFIYLCYHLTRHAALSKTRYNMKWLVEIAQLLKKHIDVMNWRYIIDMANEEGLETMLYVYLEILSKEFDITIPEYAKYNLRPKLHKLFLVNRELDFRASSGRGKFKTRNFKSAHLITGFIFSKNAMDYLYKLTSYLWKKFLVTIFC